MTLDTLQTALIDGRVHAVTQHAPVRPDDDTVRLTFACGLTLDCLPAWLEAPPTRLDEHGAPVPWAITLAEDGTPDCPGCVG